MFHHQNLESIKINNFFIKEGFQILKIYIFSAQDYLICDNIQFLFFWNLRTPKTSNFSFYVKLEFLTPLVQVFVKKTTKELTIL